MSDKKAPEDMEPQKSYEFQGDDDDDIAMINWIIVGIVLIIIIVVFVMLGAMTAVVGGV